MTRTNEEDTARIIAMTDERKEFIHLEDGYLYFAPDGSHGALSPWALRALADELDRRNAPWDAQIEQYFSTQPPESPQHD